MSGRVRIEWMNVPMSGTRKYISARIRISQANGFPGPRRSRRAAAAITVARAAFAFRPGSVAIGGASAGHSRSHRSARRWRIVYRPIDRAMITTIPIAMA